MRGIQSVMALVVACALISACEHERSVSSFGETAEEVEARRDYFRISGAVDFEGERVVYDEVIQVRVDIGVISTMGLVKGDNRVYMSRLWVTRLLRNGGALVMEVPRAGGLYSDLDHPGKPLPKTWTSSYIEKYLRPPPEILPEFYWANRQTDPTLVEAYLSESYYALPNARLKIVEPFKIDFVPPSSEAEAKAIGQKNSEPPLPLGPDGRVGWIAPFAYEIPRSEWMKIDAVASFLGGTDSNADIVLDGDLIDPLARYRTSQMHRNPHPSSQTLGIAQPVKYPDGEGVLFRRATGLYASDTIPLSCGEDMTECHTAEGQKGSLVFYREQKGPERFSVVINGENHRIDGRGAVYDHVSGSIYLLYSTLM